MRMLINNTLLLLIFLLPMGTFADEFAENKGFDFRKTKWGMSQEEVLKSEEVPVKGNSDDLRVDPLIVDDISLKADLVFESILADKNVLVSYFFQNDKLKHAMYFINQGYYDPAKHHQDFVALDKLLEKKYGKPKDNKKIWSGTESIRKEFEDPLAVYFGYLSIKTEWKFGETLISHVLKKSGTEGGIHHSILFSDKNHKPNKS